MNPDLNQRSFLSDSNHVVLLEDDDFLRVDLKSLLELAGYVVHSYSNPLEFLSTPFNFAPAVIVSDMRMPGLSGVNLQSALLEINRLIPFIFISGESTDYQIIQSMKQGAIDFLIKPFNSDQLFTAINKGIELDRAFIREIIFQKDKAFILKKLSPRESQVYELLKKGYSNSELSQTLGISLETTKQYKQEVMRKLELKSLSELIKFSSQLK
ncbi:response regulator transcription factor [Polynucleobacter rarus]|uniref:response regulator transcription factor n=1 Tax=Polynucleobacter rarus TaxID=556055 RepID=UPI000D3E3FD2|nr:response regulator [Polynucleobacter rarus]